ncbi:hypothetical protein HPG69_006259 [Diceros bicornis minor]|uniref:Uncharacterized protein n=1 Tax=Diceros bicornis minor TaxID=77932 RepID=A0A7J7EZK5_DICBM|nr:hypothetical protein HPG69_006259 [Diceros bicornis minor]
MTERQIEIKIEYGSNLESTEAKCPVKPPDDINILAEIFPQVEKKEIYDTGKIFIFAFNIIALSFLTSAGPGAAQWNNTTLLACYKDSAHILRNYRKALSMNLQNAQEPLREETPKISDRAKNMEEDQLEQLYESADQCLPSPILREHAACQDYFVQLPTTCQHGSRSLLLERTTEIFSFQLSESRRSSPYLPLEHSKRNSIPDRVHIEIPHNDQLIKVYNLSQNVQEDDFQNLQLFTEYGRLAMETGVPHMNFHMELVVAPNSWKSASSSQGNSMNRQMMNSSKLENTYSWLLSPEILDIKEINRNKITCQGLVDYFKAHIKIYQ